MRVLEIWAWALRLGRQALYSVTRLTGLWSAVAASATAGGHLKWSFLLWKRVFWVLPSLPMVMDLPLRTDASKFVRFSVESFDRSESRE